MFFQHFSTDYSESSSMFPNIDSKVITGARSSLSYFQSAMFSTVLEETILRLRVLNESNSELRICKTMIDMNHLLANKYNVELLHQDELESINTNKLGSNEYKLNKLDSDRKYVQDILLAVYNNLTVHLNYTPLKESVDSVVDRSKYLTLLIEDEAKNRAIRRDLYRQLRQQRNHMKSITYDTNVAVEGLRTKFEDSNLISEIRNRYVENWQRARTEQNAQQIKDKEDPSLEDIDYYKQKIDNEQRVHSEVELLINICINETLSKVEGWMEKYDKDIEAIELKIQKMKLRHENQFDKRIGLEEQIANHAVEIDNWLTFKRKREEARKYFEKMTNKAIIVQAWWRGLLVRQQLGPYKPTKRPGKSAKDKEKGKKMK